jgi:transposase-like protein
MNDNRHAELARRREIEDQLLALGQERAALMQNESWNRERTRRLVGPAREIGIKVRDIARFTGLSTQTLHSWMADLMRPIPDIHLGLIGPPPTTLEQAVLRTIGEEPPTHEWEARDVRARIPEGWPSGTVDEVDGALEQLVRWHMIWDGERGYRVAPPNEVAA